MGRVDKEVLKRVKGVITVVGASGQWQVVIGNPVGDADQELLYLVQIGEGAVVSTPRIGIVNHLMEAFLLAGGVEGGGGRLSLVVRGLVREGASRVADRRGERQGAGRGP